MKHLKYTTAIAGIAGLLVATPAVADVSVCITVSATGPAASLGVPENNTIPMLPAEAGGQKLNYTAFDDATDPTAAVKNVRKCIEEQQADLIIGSSTTPTTIAVAGVAAETKTPVVALAPVGLPPESEHWTFRAPQPVGQMADAIVEHMKASGVKRLGLIGYSDGYGELWINVMNKALEGSGITMEPIERFARNDTSVTGQVLKLISARPDAVLVVASGTPAALPNLALAERGYRGQIYHTHGSASLDFIRVAGASAEGTILPVGPLVVAAQLPDSHPSKALGVEYTKVYEEAHGEGSLSSFGGHMYDAGQIILATVPKAMEKGEPGSEAFRAALRDALENMEEVVGVHGVFNTTVEDHYGHDERSRVLVRVENGAWKYME
ncbi:ABC transporter substrate-binding protein [Nitratireductor mangrovi]|uniref:ABC transporter substrate-binding protein n=1 Tax=Nitratireductor mangrovi TaxID=2599600 RepID=A0A5B8KXQ3_9HYPH|nr:ABC transporter substrate-binding protein [Nitratireductor mangrovi]QDZ00342.1 ABC transporter substrate-binding protein [Nitratireductor mangrovi]